MMNKISVPLLIAFAILVFFSPLYSRQLPGDYNFHKCRYPLDDQYTVESLSDQEQNADKSKVTLWLMWTMLGFLEGKELLGLEISYPFGISADSIAIRESAMIEESQYNVFGNNILQAIESTKGIFTKTLDIGYGFKLEPEIGYKIKRSSMELADYELKDKTIPQQDNFFSVSQNQQYLNFLFRIKYNLLRTKDIDLNVFLGEATDLYIAGKTNWYYQGTNNNMQVTINETGNEDISQFLSAGISILGGISINSGNCRIDFSYKYGIKDINHRDYIAEYEDISLKVSDFTKKAWYYRDYIISLKISYTRKFINN